MFAIIDAGAQHDEERRRSGTVIVPPATRRTDRSYHSPSARVMRRVAGARGRGRCCSMTKKPSEPSESTSWNVYKAVKKAVRLGTVEAPDKSTAIEKAAQEFKAEAWRLYAVPRR
jgi:hypothetical protein